LEVSGQLYTLATLLLEEDLPGPRTGLNNVEKRKILPLLGLKLQPMVWFTKTPHTQDANTIQITYCEGTLPSLGFTARF
jgi:hypothetical protein